MIDIELELRTPGAKEPMYGSSGAIGADLFADFSAEDYKAINLFPGERRLVKTGIAIKIPPTHYGRIAPRSGLAYKSGIDVMAGVIDSDYRGEIGVILVNLGKESFVIKHGDRIAQLIFEQACTGVFHITKLDTTERGDGAFGSTG